MASVFAVTTAVSISPIRAELSATRELLSKGLTGIDAPIVESVWKSAILAPEKWTAENSL
jgi:hypothetical protein